METASGMTTPESPASTEGEETVMPRFECPPKFQEVEIPDEDEALYLEDIKGSTELWLIRTPQDFDAKRFNATTLSLDKRQVLDHSEESDACYEVLTSRSEKCLPHLLVPSKRCADLEPAPAFRGQLSIMEAVAVPPVGHTPSPPPRSKEFPPGLKQRFLPFGWKEPKRQSVDKADTGRVETEPQETKKRKKTKSPKDKKRRTAADITQSSEEGRPRARQDDTRGGAGGGGWGERLAVSEEAGVGEIADDGVTTEAHRRSKKRKQQDHVRNDNTVHRSHTDTDETQPLKKKKKRKK